MGDTGIYQISHWNKETKENDVQQYEDCKSWYWNVLFFRYLSQLKRKKEKRTFDFRTREFQDFKSEPIELLHLTFGQDAKTEVKETYDNYQDFKAKTSSTDKMTGETTTPFDFWIALYVLDAKGDVVKFTFKGDSRTAWFDFMKNYQTSSEFNPVALCQATVEFGMEKKTGTKKNEQGEFDVWYAATFKVVGLAEGEKLADVEAKYNGLASWMNAWAVQQKKEQIIRQGQSVIRTEPPETLPVIDALADNGLVSKEELETRLEDIPF